MNHPHISRTRDANSLTITVATDGFTLTPHKNISDGEMGFTCKMAGYDLDDVLNQMKEDYSFEYIIERIKALTP